MKPRLYIVVNDDWFFLSHRKEIALGAVKAGYDVTLVARESTKREEIERLGIHFINLVVNPTGKNPLEELRTLTFLVRLFKHDKPTIVHNVGLKLFLWGGIAARIAKVPEVVNAVSGLGVMFSGAKLGFISRLMVSGMRWGMNRKKAFAIFQNTDDRSLFLKHKVVLEEQCVFIKGSGCDLSEYAYTPDPHNEKSVVLFTGRMVKEKGVATLVDAANILREEYGDKVKFVMCGGLSPNPTAYRKEEIDGFCDGEYIQWLGLRHDIPEQLRNCNIVAFPSYYREGVPKSLIEACATGRPIITTNSVGCRDTVEDGVNGFLVEPRDGDMLASKLRILFDDSALRARMGRASREKAEKEFDVNDVVRKHIEIYNHVR